MSAIFRIPNKLIYIWQWKEVQFYSKSLSDSSIISLQVDWSR